MPRGDVEWFLPSREDAGEAELLPPITGEGLLGAQRSSRAAMGGSSRTPGPRRTTVAWEVTWEVTWEVLGSLQCTRLTRQGLL